MKNLTYRLLLASLCCMMLVMGSLKHVDAASPQPKKVGIILPIEHQALREIIQGFEDTLQLLYKNPIKFKISNAQGDANLQHAIIAQMRDANYDLIVPIATNVTQMTASIVNTQPIVGLAANVTDKKNNLVRVDDEIDKEQLVAFIRKVYPQLNKVSLVYSVTGKSFLEAKQIARVSAHYHINLHHLPVQNLADLYSASKAIPADTQAILILKDNLVASGIEILIKIAKEKKIALITSDDGTVHKGAGFALGVPEKDIGIAGAKLAAQILQGTAPSNLADIKLTKLTVFLNPQALAEEGQAVDAVSLAAKQSNYPVVIIK